MKRWRAQPKTRVQHKDMAETQFPAAVCWDMTSIARKEPDEKLLYVTFHLGIEA